MKGFLRSVRLAFRFRFTLLGAMVCSLMVGALWGVNIGTLYPFIEVVSHGESLQESLQRKLAEAERELQELRTSIGQLEREARNAPRQDQIRIKKALMLKESRATAEERTVAHIRWCQPYADRYLPHDPFLTLVMVIAALMLGTLLKSLFLVGSIVLVARVTERTVCDLQNEFYSRTLRLDLSTFSEDRAGRLMSRFTHDVRILAAALKTLFGQAVREPFKMAACLIGASFVSWRLLVLSLLVAPLGFLLLRLLTQAIKRASQLAMSMVSEVYQQLSESFHGIRTVKAFTMEPYERSRFHVATVRIRRRREKLAFYMALTKPISEVMSLGIISVAILAGAFVVLNRETHLLGIKISDRPLDPAKLMVFFGFLVGGADPARKMSGVFAQLFMGFTASERVFRLMDREPSIKDPPNPLPLPRPHRELQFENVHMAYLNGEPVLEGINLRIRFGERIAIVGPNGCGKTTLANLLPRFVDPTLGVVRLDGIDLKQFSIRELRRQIGMVTQDTWLFDDTVMNNIRYGNSDASDQEVILAARQAHADVFIRDKLANGYDTIVGERGGRLSGGQRQRLALARAMLRNPDILILDEATSEIDLESERLIHTVLAEFTHSRTTIMITHRLSTLELADRIVVMDHGRILDVGSHDELTQRCEIYKQLQLTQLRKSA